MPDRYAEAVRSRRAELRAHQLILAGGHRAEIRTACGQARLAVAAEVAGMAAELARQAEDYLNGADRAARQRFPALLTVAVEEAGARLRERVAALALPALRRVAARRGVPAAWTSLCGTAPERPAGLPGPEPPPGRARLLAPGAGGYWRLALLPAATVPLLGPSLGIGLALLGIVLAVWQRWVAAERARLRRWSADVLAAARARFDAELGQVLLDLELRAGALLDAAVTTRRAQIEAELRALAPAPRTGADDALD
ncbi:hypothetical protein ACFQE5_17795 [Pseudonocardia hispaniensis]|uniref:Uncharacterized protein n=1 Tax=Pseudonocardia hispaniensis TaxID=904933 RepID=A0ABW1J5T1_9PSEU